MKLIAWIGDWINRRRDKKARKLPDDYNDLVSLFRKGIVSARGTGQSISDIRAEIISRVRLPVKVLVKHGTYFVSEGAHQNMVTRKEYRFVLDPLEARSIQVPASCINAALPIPGGNDKFRGVSRVSRNLSRFLEAVEGEDAMTIQAGVWAITDNYTASQIQQHLRIRRSSRTGICFDSNSYTDGGPAISSSKINRAKEILNELGIRTNL
jgi:hypothetical protein